MRNLFCDRLLRSFVSGYSASVLPGSLRLPVVFQRAWHWVRRQLPTLDPKDLLPLGIEVTKGAIICGNPSTPNLLVAEFGRTEGMFGIVQVRAIILSLVNWFRLYATVAVEIRPLQAAFASQF